MIVLTARSFRYLVSSVSGLEVAGPVRMPGRFIGGQVSGEETRESARRESKEVNEHGLAEGSALIDSVQLSSRWPGACTRVQTR